MDVYDFEAADYLHTGCSGRGQPWCQGLELEKTEVVLLHSAEKVTVLVCVIIGLAKSSSHV